VAVLRVEALDAEGRHVPTADDLIEFTVTGEGAVIGVGNGDPNCHEADKPEPGKKPQRSLYNGLAQVIIQSTKMAGEITVEASGGGWNAKVSGTKLTIQTEKVALRPAVA
jgi:beta-galactosidase